MASQHEYVISACGDRPSDAERSRWEINQSDRPVPLLRGDDDDQHPGYLQYADVVMDLTALRARRGKRSIHLKPTEFRLLRLLLEQPERAFTREQLKAGVWGYGAKLDPRSISVYLGRLRRALTENGEPNLIRTITGHGYSLDANCADMR